MNNSIQQFQQEGVKRLSDIFVEYSNDFSKQAEMICGVRDVVLKLGRDIIKEEWESYDEILRNRKDLRKGWYIVREDEITRTTSLGDITYNRTLFKNKETGIRAYLSDERDHDGLVHLVGDDLAHAHLTGGCSILFHVTSPPSHG